MFGKDSCNCFEEFFSKKPERYVSERVADIDMCVEGVEGIV